MNKRPNYTDFTNSHNPKRPYLSHNPGSVGFNNNDPFTATYPTDLEKYIPKPVFESDFAESFNIAPNERVTENKLIKRNKYVQGRDTAHIMIENKKNHIHSNGKHSDEWCSCVNLINFNILNCFFDPKPETVKDFISAKKYLDELTILGVATVQNGGTTNSNEFRGDRVNRNDNLEVVGYLGTVMCHNYWGGYDLFAGDSLGLILKQVDYSSKSIKDNFGFNVSDRSLFKTPKTTIPYQLIPWASSKTLVPSLSDLEFIDCFGIKRYGVYIKMGISQNRVTPVSDFDLFNACTNYDYIGKLDLIEVTLTDRNVI